MENMFENAYFGKAYKTRAGYKAIWLQECSLMPHGKIVYEVRCENTSNYTVGSSGLVADSILNKNMPSEFDIIGELEEDINEEELDRLARKYAVEEYQYELIDTDVDVHCCIEDFKAGYRKAKNER